MKIEYPTFISQTFPKVPQVEIWRENLLTTIHTTLDGDIDVLFLEGPEGIGKTTLSSQFARESDRRVVSLFIRNTSKLAYDPYILRLDLCQQIYFILDKGELPDAELVDEGFLRNLIYKLQREASKIHKSIYFVIDGLDEIPAAEHEALNSVLEILPWGMRGFQFLISGDKKVVPESNKRCKNSKSFIIPGFSLDDTIRYFNDLELERSAVEDIYKSSKGLPGHLEAIRRILLSGTDREKLLADLPDQLPSLFEVEWQTVDSGGEQLRNRPYSP